MEKTAFPPVVDVDVKVITINIKYFTTKPGIIKFVQFVFASVCMYCASPAYVGATVFFLFAVAISFIATCLWICINIIRVPEVLTLSKNWTITEFINTGFNSLLYLIASSVQLANWNNFYIYDYGWNMAAGAFGMINFVAYAAGTYCLYQDLKKYFTFTVLV